MLNQNTVLALSKYDFGNQQNNAVEVFSDFLAKRKDKISYWQIVHLKSSAHEGYLAYLILSERQKQSLSIRARHFFSVHSPLEKFLPNNFIYNKPIYNHKQYLLHHQDVLEIFENVLPKLTTGSEEYFAVSKIIDLLRLQLYGFGHAALTAGYLNRAIFAFKLANVLDKNVVQEILKNYQYHKTQDRYLKL